MLLNSPNSLRVSTAAAWVLGTAVKGHLQLQLKALEAGAAPLLLKMLDDATSRCFSLLNHSAPTIDECLLPVKAANKAIYAIAGLLRFNSRSQDELVALDAPAVLLRALNLQRTIHTAASSSSAVGKSSLTQVLRQANTLSLKVLNVVSDLYSDEISTAERYAAAMKRGNNTGPAARGEEDEKENNATALLTRVSLENGERLAATLSIDAQAPIPTPAPLLHTLRMPQHSTTLCRVIQSFVSTSSVKIVDQNGVKEEQDEEIAKSVNDAALQALKALCPVVKI